MPFWSSQTIKARGANIGLVKPFDARHVHQGAYELAMGPQGAISSDGHNRITKLEPRQSFCVPRGQFGLLLTEETVSIPSNVVAFISLKTSVKSLGLVNVSGFHVDPGYDCRLKFWVYNAGN
jgi:dCTP deaminase